MNIIDTGEYFEFTLGDLGGLVAGVENISTRCKRPLTNVEGLFAHYAGFLTVAKDEIHALDDRIRQGEFIQYPGIPIGPPDTNMDAWHNARNALGKVIRRFPRVPGAPPLFLDWQSDFLCEYSSSF
jgi:hypothetical protein